MVSDLTGEVADSPGTVADSIAAASESLQNEIAEVSRPITEKAARVADAEKAFGADKLKAVARAVHAAANDLDSEMPDVASHVRRAGAWMDDSACHLREQRFDELVGSVEAFARKNPALAFMAASLCGLAIARFLKSSKQNQTP